MFSGILTVLLGVFSYIYVFLFPKYIVWPKGDFRFYVKWLACCFYLKFWKRRQRKVFDYDISSRNLERMGIVPTSKEWLYEMAQPVVSSGNTLCFSGYDPDGNSLYVSLRRLPDRVSEVYLYLALADGRVYTLPQQPHARVHNTNPNRYTAGGLSMQLQEPMRRWRIVYNGYLREGVRHEWKGDAKDDRLIYCKFALAWRPLYSWYDNYQDFSISCVANDLAKRPNLREALRNFSITDCYDQYGQIRGCVSIQDEEEKELMLWGTKIKELGTRLADDPSSDRLTHAEEYQGYEESGIGFRIWQTTNSKSGSSSVQGYICLPNLAVYPVLQSTPLVDLNSNSVFSLSAGPKEYKFKFTRTAHSSSTVYLGKNWSAKQVLSPVSFELNGRSGRGFSLSVTKSDIPCPVSMERTLPMLQESGLKDTAKSIVRLEDEESRSGRIVGGKGMSLGLMSSLKSKDFIIPRGVCITNTAFLKHLNTEPKLEEAVKSMTDIAWKRKAGDLKEECERVTELFSSTPLNAQLRTKLKEALLREWPELKENFNRNRLAVRSSAIGEDGEEMSAAGQNETFLGVRSVDDILLSLIKCWAAQFSFRSVEYKRQHGQLLNAGMGVVIQEMVAADVAGVLFTRDPVSGNPGVMLITANYGLGESVVSASAEPDTVTVGRNWDDKLVILNKKLGGKHTRVVMSDDSGIVEEEIPFDESRSSCLSDELAFQLAQIGMLLEKSYGSPRDIEWAVKDGRIYLLQSRPITTLDPESEYELIHEFDSPHITGGEFLTTANVGEVCPLALSPISHDIIGRVLCCIMQGFFLPPGNDIKYSPVGAFVAPSSHGRMLMNRIQWKVNDVSKEKPTALTLATNLAMHGRKMDDDQLLHDIARDRYGQPTKLNAFLILLIVIKNLIFTNREKNKGIKRFGNYSIPGLESASSAREIFSTVVGNTRDQAESLCPHFMTSTKSMMVNVGTMVILMGDSEEPTLDHYRDLAALLGTANGAESGEVPNALKKVASVIASSDEGKQFPSMSPHEALHWLQNDVSAPATAFRDFLQRHGHRGLQEFDVMSLPWRLQPEKLVTALQKMVSCPSSFQTNAVDESINVEKVLKQLRTPLSITKRLILKYLLPIGRAAVCSRETTKSLMIKVTDGFRTAYRLLGDVMLKEGRIPDAELVFFFSLSELKEFLQSRSARLLIKANRRRRLNPYLNSLVFPEVMRGVPKPIDPQRQQAHSNESTQKITAFPVYEGYVKARARVAITLSEAETIQQGEILITHSTDICWTPYFPMLSGIVTELGGLISHGAVVAREYGLPCLVGAEGATKIFKSGDLVILDSVKGSLEKVME